MRESETVSVENTLQVDPNYFFQTPHNAKHLGWLFGMVFGVRSGESSLVFPSEYVPLAAEAVEAALLTLSPREEKVIRMRLGLTLREKYHTQQNIADYFGVSRYRIRQIESNALRKLRHPSRANGLKVFLESPEAELRRFLAQRSSSQRLIELVPVIEKIKRLEPSLIAHLRQHNDDLLKINPILFEHLFAECLAARRFDDVRLVGRNAKTSADIFAAKFIPGPDIPMRVFVEVKRWKDTIGIEVIIKCSARSWVSVSGSGGMRR